jgi:muconolactone delta-isomerase
MRFLVTGEFIDPGPAVPPDQALGAVEMLVVPSFQMLAGLEQQGKVKGGTFPGERSGALIIDVESFEELDSLLNHLPFFGVVKWDVKPLMPYASIAQQLPGDLRDARQMMQGGAPG